MDKIETGDFTTDSKYIRDLVRRDKAQNEMLLELKIVLEEG